MKQRIFPALMMLALIAPPTYAASLPARAPGLWKSVTTVLGANGQPMAGAGHVVTVSCVDALTDHKFFMDDASACSSLKLSGADGHYKIEGTCQRQGRPAKISETLDYVGAKAVTLSARLVDGGQSMTVTSKRSWQGACLPGMNPGDIGIIAHGVFHKAGNIEDQNH